MPVSLDRFLRIIGGQIFSASVAVLITYWTGNAYDPAFAGFAVLIGAALTAFDKYARDSGWYGNSLERLVG